MEIERRIAQKERDIENAKNGVARAAMLLQALAVLRISYRRSVHRRRLGA